MIMQKIFQDVTDTYEMSYGLDAKQHERSTHEDVCR